MKLLPCPFCEGPPVVIAHDRDGGRNHGHVFYGMKRYPSKGKCITAYVFCHECGAQGPGADEIACEAADLWLCYRKAVDGWNERDNRHCDMYDEARGLNDFPLEGEAA